MTIYQSPFQFGTLATNENFIDRKEDRALLKQLLSSHINVMLISSQPVKQIYNLGNPNTIVKNKKTLQNKDIIEKQNDGFVFVDPIYCIWFKGEYR